MLAPRSCDRCHKTYQPTRVQQRWCIDCRPKARRELAAAKARQYYAADREKLNQKGKDWRAAHPDLIRDYRRKSYTRACDVCGRGIWVVDVTRRKAPTYVCGRCAAVARHTFVCIFCGRKFYKELAKKSSRCDECFGVETAVADLCGVTRQAVSLWIIKESKRRGIAKREAVRLYLASHTGILDIP